MKKKVVKVEEKKVVKEVAPKVEKKDQNDAQWDYNNRGTTPAPKA